MVPGHFQGHKGAQKIFALTREKGKNTPKIVFALTREETPIKTPIFFALTRDQFPSVFAKIPLADFNNGRGPGG